MKPAPFEYFAPLELQEALDLLERYGDEAKILAGGQSLMPLMNLRLARPGLIIDINRLSGLDTITATPEGGLTIGALPPFQLGYKNCAQRSRGLLLHQRYQTPPTT